MKKIQHMFVFSTKKPLLLFLSLGGGQEVPAEALGVDSELGNADQAPIAREPQRGMLSRATHALHNSSVGGAMVLCCTRASRGEAQRRLGSGAARVAKLTHEAKEKERRANHYFGCVKVAVTWCVIFFNSIILEFLEHPLRCFMDLVDM